MKEDLILLIDDNEITLKSLSKALEMNGFPNHSFRDPLQAIDSYTQHKYPIVITDYKMPVMNGIDVLEVIKEMNAEANFIIYTGYPNAEIIDEIKQTKAKWFIKPIKLTEMIGCLENIKTNLKEDLK
jgi:DNA-binding NtrC family response regulator